MPLSGTYDTTNPGAAVGNREHLKDVLSILEPEEAPILSMLSKGKAEATFVETIMDTYEEPNTDGVGEGEDVTVIEDAFEGRARSGNYVQTFRRSFGVSKLQQAAKSVGPAKYAQAEAKKIVELKRDIEATLASDNDRQQENGAGSKYKLRGLGKWIDSSGPADILPAYRTPAGAIETNAQANFSETKFNDYITALHRVSGKVNSLVVAADTTLRRAISDFERLGNQTTTVRNVNYEGGSGSITVSVNTYMSDHGAITIMNGNPACMPSTTTTGWAGYLLNLNYVNIDEYIPLKSEPLPDMGGGPRGYVECTLTLSMKHTGAHGKIRSST